MQKAFLDANIFIAATASARGGSRLIFDLARAHRVTLVTVRHALFEAERNIETKLGRQYLSIYYDLLFAGPVAVQPLEHISPEDMLAVRNVLPLKDVPILLGALYSQSPFLLTLDQKDFLRNRKLQELRLSCTILTPGSFIQDYLE